LLPIIVPIILVFFSEPKSADEEQLLQPSIVAETTPVCNEISDKVISKHVTFEDEKPPWDTVQFHAKVFQTVTSVEKKIKQKKWST